MTETTERELSKDHVAELFSQLRRYLTEHKVPKDRLAELVSHMRQYLTDRELRKDRLLELFEQLRRYHPIGVRCENCDSELWIAEHSFHDELVSIRCQCRMQFVRRTALPRSQHEWQRFWNCHWWSNDSQKAGKD